MSFSGVAQTDDGVAQQVSVAVRTALAAAENGTSEHIRLAGPDDLGGGDGGFGGDGGGAGRRSTTAERNAQNKSPDALSASRARMAEKQAKDKANLERAQSAKRLKEVREREAKSIATRRLSVASAAKEAAKAAGRRAHLERVQREENALAAEAKRALGVATALVEANPAAPGRQRRPSQKMGNLRNEYLQGQVTTARKKLPPTPTTLALL
jgi:hypothetical protein